MLQHPTKIGQVVKFIPSRNNSNYSSKTIFKVIDIFRQNGITFITINPINHPLKSRRDNIVHRFADRFIVIPTKISYTKDLHGTICNKPEPKPIQRNEDHGAQLSVPSRGISMDSCTYGTSLRESTTSRQPSPSIDSIASRLWETSSENSRPSIREDFFQWTRGLIDDARYGGIEIHRLYYATEARHIESNQSARYQRNPTTRHPVSPHVPQSRPAGSFIL